MLKCLGCGKEFLYAAKKILIYDVSFPVDDNGRPLESKIDDDTNLVRTVIPETIESHCCPYCYGSDLREVEKTEPQIESIISVEIKEADALLKQGYEVRDAYATKVTLVKKAEEEKQK